MTMELFEDFAGHPVARAFLLAETNHSRAQPDRARIVDGESVVHPCTTSELKGWGTRKLDRAYKPYLGARLLTQGTETCVKH